MIALSYPLHNELIDVQ